MSDKKYSEYKLEQTTKEIQDILNLLTKNDSASGFSLVSDGNGTVKFERTLDVQNTDLSSKSYLSKDANNTLKVNFDQLREDLNIPSANDLPNVESIAHQYATSNSKDSVASNSTWSNLSAASFDGFNISDCIVAGDYAIVCGTKAGAGAFAYALAEENYASWTLVDDRFVNGISSVAYGKGKFILLDNKSNLHITQDVSSNMWISKTTVAPTQGSFTAILFVNNRFIIIGNNICAMSDDGETWTTSAMTGYGHIYNDVAFGNGCYVAGGNSGKIAISYNGKAWEDISSDSWSHDIKTVNFNKGKFIIAGKSNTIAYSSTPELGWLPISIAQDNVVVEHVNKIIYVEDRYYAACTCVNTSGSGTSGAIMSSSDGSIWELANEADYPYSCLDFEADFILAAGFNATASAVKALDLNITWRDIQPEPLGNQHLWERVLVTLSDGRKITSNAIYITHADPKDIHTVTSIDTIYNSVDSLPSDKADGTVYACMTNGAAPVTLWRYNAASTASSKWEYIDDCRDNVIYCMLRDMDDAAVLYRFDSNSNTFYPLNTVHQMAINSIRLPIPESLTKLNESLVISNLSDGYTTPVLYDNLYRLVSWNAAKQQWVVRDTLTEQGLYVVLSNVKAHRGTSIEFSANSILRWDSTNKKFTLVQSGDLAAKIKTLDDNKVSKANLKDEIEADLTAAKASGDFDGPQGVSLEFEWKADSQSTLGVKTSDQSQYQYRDLRGPQGPAGPTYNLTAKDKSDIAELTRNKLAEDEWTFVLKNGQTITRKVCSYE